MIDYLIDVNPRFEIQDTFGSYPEILADTVELAVSAQYEIVDVSSVNFCEVHVEIFGHPEADNRVKQTKQT